jgi:hypothetical protein
MLLKLSNFASKNKNINEAKKAITPIVIQKLHAESSLFNGHVPLL